ncbi:EAL domain-containing protein [Mycobacterium pyrenivorans]|nr:EAL domain-containing protein [Mycolicibacterium pyrenivorans]
MVDVCGALGLDVLAEGIESAAQADMVHTAGCRMAQGYLFGRPVRMSEMRAALSSHRQKASPGAGSTPHGLSHRHCAVNQPCESGSRSRTAATTPGHKRSS